MNDKCPNCGKKLSPFYMKQNCPECNTNLLYYDFENRLKEDHDKAIKEQEAVDRFLRNLKLSTVGTGISLIRFILFFSPLVWMCLPMFKTSDGRTTTLVSVIMGIVTGETAIGKIFGDPLYLYPIITMVCIILFSLAVIISSCFSTGRKSLVRNEIFSVINTVVLTVCLILSLSCGMNISIGSALVVITYLITFVMHIFADKRIKQIINKD